MRPAAIVVPLPGVTGTDIENLDLRIRQDQREHADWAPGYPRASGDQECILNSHREAVVRECQCLRRVRDRHTDRTPAHFRRTLRIDDLTRRCACPKEGCRIRCAALDRQAIRIAAAVSGDVTNEVPHRPEYGW